MKNHILIIYLSNDIQVINWLSSKKSSLSPPLNPKPWLKQGGNWVWTLVWTKTMKFSQNPIVWIQNRTLTQVRNLTKTLFKSGTNLKQNIIPPLRFKSNPQAKRNKLWVPSSSKVEISSEHTFKPKSELKQEIQSEHNSMP